jgi:hypothetical protein
VSLQQKKVEPLAICLPPCVPKQSRVHDRSEHPFAVELRLELRGNLAEDEKAEDKSVEPRKVTYFVHPEFTAPKKNGDKADVRVAQTSSNPAVLGTKKASEDKSDATAVADQWAWGPPGTETMHPFWAVRRLTPKQLAKEASEASDGLRPRFNCTLRPQMINTVVVGVVNGQALNTTRMCQVPFLYNTMELEEGEELFLEVPDKPDAKKKPQKRTWTNAHTDSETNKQSKG